MPKKTQNRRSDQLQRVKREKQLERRRATKQRREKKRANHSKDAKNHGPEHLNAAAITLGQVIDAKRALEEIENANQDFIKKEQSDNKITNLYSNTRLWDGIPLINHKGTDGVEGLKFGGTPNSGTSFDAEPTQFLKACPYIKSILEGLEKKYNSKIQFARVLRVSAGGYIAPHRDGKGPAAFGNKKYRMAIPIVTSFPNVSFTIANETYFLKAGDFVLTDVNQIHSVKNESDIDRIHIVADFKRTPKLDAALAKGKFCDKTPIYFHEEDGNNRIPKENLIISFGGLGIAGAIPPGPRFIFNSLRKIDDEYDILFVRDLEQYWYSGGVKGISSSLDETVEYFQKFIDEKGYKSVTTIGQSAGAFIALYVGNKIQAEKIIAYSPQTALDARKRKRWNDKRWAKRMITVQKNADAFQLDLANLDFANQKVYVLYATCKRTAMPEMAKLDGLHAKNLKSSTGSIILKKYNVGDQNPHRLTLALSNAESLNSSVEMCIYDKEKLLSQHSPVFKAPLPTKPTVWKAVFANRRRRSLNGTSQHTAAIHQWVKKNKSKAAYKRIRAEDLDNYRNQIKPWDIVILPYDYADINKKKESSLFAKLCKKLPRGRILNKSAILERAHDRGVGSKRGFAKFAKRYRLPIPKTWDGERWLQLKRKPKLHSYIVKKSLGAMGQEVHLCKTYDDIEKVLNKYGADKCIVQEKIETGEEISDIRIWIVGDKCVGAIKRIVKIGTKEFRTNLSLGCAHGEIYSPTKDELDLCFRAYKKSGLDFVAFDLIRNARGKLFFIEANITPGLNSTSEILKTLKSDYASAIIEESTKIMNKETPTPSWKK